MSEGTNDPTQWPPPPKSAVGKSEEEMYEKEGKLLTGNQWCDLLLGFLSGLLFFVALFSLVFNPYIAKLFPLANSNTHIVSAWLTATSVSCFFGFTFLRNHRVFRGLFLFGGGLLALPSLFVIIIFWWL